MQGKKYISSIWRRKCKYNNMKKLKDLYYPKSNRTFTTSSLDTDVAIIGGGAIGCSIANFLLTINPSIKVSVIEKDLNYNIASSVLSVGSIRQQFSEPVNIAISQFGIEYIRELSQDPETDVQFDEGGYLFLAQEKGKKQLEENVALQQSLGSSTVHYGGHGDELSTKFPWLQTEDIQQSAFGVKDEGWFDPYTLTMALKKKAQEKGAQFIEGTVEEIGKKAEHVIISSSVDSTDNYKIKCNHALVNAAGCWSSQVLSTMVGIDETKANELLPVHPRKRFVFVVHCPDNNLISPPVPLLVCPSGCYIRREGLPDRKLFLVGGMESAAGIDKNAMGTADELFVEHEHFENHLWPSIAYRIPAFENCKVKSSWCGYYDYNTADQNGLLGKIFDDIPLYVATGFSGHGIQQSPAVGRGIAELILNDNQYQSLDLSDLNASRIQEGRFVIEKNIV